MVPLKSTEHLTGRFTKIFLWQIMRNRGISNSKIYKLCSIEPWYNDIKRRGLKCLATSCIYFIMRQISRHKRKQKKTYKGVGGGQPTSDLAEHNKEILQWNAFNLDEAFNVAYSRNIYNLFAAQWPEGTTPADGAEIVWTMMTTRISRKIPFRFGKHDPHINIS